MARKALTPQDLNSNKIINLADGTASSDAVNKSQLDTKVAATVISSNGMGYVNHGSTASTARPTGFASVTWRGTVAPTNATSADFWVDEA